MVLFRLGDVLSHPRDKDAIIQRVDDALPPRSRTELDAMARRIAGFLAAAEAAGARVLLSLPPGPEFFAAFFGCVYAGMIPVPAPPPIGARRLARLRRIADVCGARRILCAPPAADAAALGLVADPLNLLAKADPIAPVAAAPDQVAYLQFTSGSTSSPRGVKITHRAALANIAALSERFGDHLDGWAVSWLPLHHDMGLVTSLLAIQRDLSLALLPPTSFTRRPRSWLEAISDYRACLSGGPNFAFETLCHNSEPADARPLDLSGWKIAFCGAEQVREPVMRRFAQRFSPAGFAPTALMPAYGLAEFTLFATATEVTDPVRFRTADAENKRRVCDLGRPASGHRVLIVDPETRAPLPDGQIGEVLLDGPSKGAGYWAEDSEAVFKVTVPSEAGAFLRTGDLGFLAEGRLYVVGRLKELIIVRGRNLHPEEVEETARTAHPVLRAAAAAFARNEAAGFGLICEVQSGARRTTYEPLIEAIQRELARTLGATASLIALVRAGALPRSSSGKLLRSQYEGMLTEGHLRPLLVWRADTAPVAVTQTGGPPDRAQIRAWIGEYLAMRVGIAPGSLADGDLLQDLGLDSMGAVELAYALEDWLRRPVEPTIVWHAPSLGGLCALLAGETEATDGSAASDVHAAADLEQALRAVETLSDDQVAALYDEQLQCSSI